MNFKSKFVLSYLTINSKLFFLKHSLPLYPIVVVYRWWYISIRLCNKPNLSLRSHSNADRLSYPLPWFQGMQREEKMQRLKAGFFSFV